MAYFAKLRSELSVHKLQEFLPTPFTRMVFIGTIQSHLDTLSGYDASPNVRVVRVIGVTIAIRLQTQEGGS